MSISYVYTLISSAEDYYLEQAFASMYSLRHQMPEAHIILVTDERTKLSFTGIRSKEIQYVDDIIVVPIEDEGYSQKQRSRILKTSVRQNLSGDYLYIDCDTIITKPLDSIADTPYELAACMDSHSLFIDDPYRWFSLLHGQKLEWPVENEKLYFNSGVIYVKDSPLCHKFYAKWNSNLISGFAKGVDMDQPAFAKTNYEMGHPIQVLDGIWNCQLKHGIRYLKDARIIHYLTTNASPRAGRQLFRFNDIDLFEEVKLTGDISEEIRVICQDPFLGIAPLTHCFSGDDIYFFQTSFFRTLCREEAPFKDVLEENRVEPFYESELYQFISNRYPSTFTRLLEKIMRLGQSLKRR